MDWVELGTSTISASVSVLRRIAAADVHVGTLAVAHAIAGTFWLSRTGEDRVGETLSRLQSFSPLGNALYFGFAIDHPVRHLARTQNGYACLALLGSLAELTSETEVAAKVLSELTGILGAPRNSRPSLRQRRSILRCCSGILSATTFPCVTEHFLRLAHVRTPKAKPEASVGNPRDIAVVLDAISRLSRKQLVSIELSGNDTCAWLAAFGNYFFELGVDIRDRNGELLHQSVSEHGHVHLFITFGTSAEARNLVGAQCYIVRDVTDLLTRDHTLLSGRVEWDAVLSTIFAEPSSELLRLETPFEQILRSAARLFEAVATADPTIDTEFEMALGKSGFGGLCRSWIGYHDDSRGLGYIKFARDLLPELAATHLKRRQVLDIDVLESVLGYEEAACEIERLYQGAACNANPGSSTNALLCLTLIVESVIIMLWALSLVKSDRNLRLHKFGVRKVCERWESTQLEIEVYKRHSRRRLGRLLQYLTLATLQDAIRDLFTAPLNLHENKENSWDCSSAYSSYGICIFLKLVAELNPQPEQEKWLQVLPGSIASESGVQYQRVGDYKSTMAKYPVG